MAPPLMVTAVGVEEAPVRPAFALADANVPMLPLPTATSSPPSTSPAVLPWVNVAPVTVAAVLAS